MNTIVIQLPDYLVTQLRAERISNEQLNSFVVAVLEAWLRLRHAAGESQSEIAKLPLSEAFRGSAVDFIDQLIAENRDLFEELARL